MKKSFFLSILAVGALVACSKSEVVDTKFDQAISFENYVGRDAMTKAAVTDKDNIVEQTIGLYGFYTGAKKWEAAGVANPTANLWSNDALTYTEANGWATDENKYWTNATDWYSFLAYAPQAATGNGVTVSGESANDVAVTYTCTVTEGKLATDVDLLYAQVVNTNKVPSVSLAFQHALSRVTVKASANTNDMGIQFDVKNVTLSGTYNTTGTLNLATTNWAEETTKTEADYVFYNDDAAATIAEGVATDALTSAAVDYAGTDNYLMMIPTEFDGTLSVTYTTIYEGQESNPMTKKLPIAINFEKGNAYTINLAFEPVLEVIKFTVDVAGWRDETPVSSTDTEKGNNPENYPAI